MSTQTPDLRHAGRSGYLQDHPARPGQVDLIRRLVREEWKGGARGEALRAAVVARLKAAAAPVPPGLDRLIRSL